MGHAEILRDYDEALPALRASAEAIHRDLEARLLSDPAIKLHSVTYRLKGRDSLARKLARPDKSYGGLWDVTDLVGLRVITYFEDAVDRVAQLVERALPVALEHSIDKRKRRDSTAFGYRSLHYVCRLDLPAAESAPPSAPCFEIQVRSVLEHAWAEIEHDLGYKAHDVVPPEARRRLSRLAGLLELADQEFVAIRAGLEAYASSLPDRIAAARESVALDRISLVPLLSCDEVRDADEAIARALGTSLAPAPFYPEYLVRMMSAAGVRTVEDARSGVRDHAPTLVGMVRPYFDFARSAWNLQAGPDHPLPRGYSLFFLAHAALLEASTLRIDKVARLTQLYRTLDYPEDERAAQQVAIRLVDAFGGVG